MKFADYIRRKGFTTKSLAEKSGVSVRSLECYTTGRFKWRNARLWFAEAIADTLEISTKTLMGFDD